ncbi:hypothetical protein MIMGU_mgv1a025980mg, partial [Erythranthe guttata]
SHSKLVLLERMIKQLFPELESQNWPPTLVQSIWKTRRGFWTPCNEQLLNALPPKSHTARVAFVSPKFVSPEKMACVVHLAGISYDQVLTSYGDHTFDRRLRLGGPLLKENIAIMVLQR